LPGVEGIRLADHSLRIISLGELSKEVGIMGRGAVMSELEAGGCYVGIRYARCG
jgi:hypothetical protein